MTAPITSLKGILLRLTPSVLATSRTPEGVEYQFMVCRGVSVLEQKKERAS